MKLFGGSNSGKKKNTPQSGSGNRGGETRRTSQESRPPQQRSNTESRPPQRTNQGTRPPQQRTNTGARPPQQRANPQARAYTQYDDVPVKKRPKKKKRRWRIVLVSIAAVVLLLGAAYAIWSRPPSTVDEAPATAAPNIGDSAEDPSDIDDTPDNSLRRKDTYTFLLIGEDATGKGASGNTDTIIVGMLDVGEGKLNMISIPRDIITNRNVSTRKINAVYRSSGIEGMMDAVKDIIGYPVDHYAVVDLIAFEKLVDAIGGVDFDVPRNMHYDDPTQDFYVHIDAGMQHLNGEDALKVVRFRGYGSIGYPDGDIGRIATQQAFLKATAKQMLQLKNVLKVNEIADIFVKYVDTSLASGEIAWLGEEFLKLSEENINFYRVPGDDGYYIRFAGESAELSYVSVKVDEWLEILNEALNPWEIEITSENLNLLTIDNGVLKTTSSAGTDAVMVSCRLA